MSTIFISYRRAPGASETAGRLHDRLAGKYGESQVFMDVDTVRPGSDFVKAVREAIESSAVVIVVIDPHWAIDATGRNRIAEAGDYVRLEVGTALQLGVTVIPVLIQGAQLPTYDQLPPDLRGIRNLQAVVLSHERFTTDVQPLEREIDDALSRAEPTTSHPEPPPRRETTEPPKSRRRLGVYALVAILVVVGVVIAGLLGPNGSFVLEHHELIDSGHIRVIVTNNGDEPGPANVRCEVLLPEDPNPQVIDVGQTEVIGPSETWEEILEIGNVLDIGMCEAF